MGSWLQPWSEENNACLINLDTYAESMQLEELFGQTQSVIYDAFGKALILRKRFLFSHSL